MSKGQRYPAESREHTDAASGRRIRQITSHPSIHHHPFFFVPAYDRAMTRLVFVSYRTGLPQIFFEDRATAELVQATDRPDLADWSIIPSERRPVRLFHRRHRRAFASTSTPSRRSSLPTSAPSRCARRAWSAPPWAPPRFRPTATGGRCRSRPAPVTRFVLIDTQQKTSRVFLERDTIGHPQFCPDDDDLILYAGPLTDRVWLTDRSGAKNRRLYQRENNLQWVTHEVWVPGRRTVAFVDWPRGMKMIDVDRGVVRQLTYSPAWHAAPDDDGERFVCDTNLPDRGLHTFGVDDDPADDAEFLAASEASSEGKHWGGPFPYNDGPVAVEAAQHTHPHPRFSPDGSRVLFTSDKTGHAQLMK